MCVGYNQDTTCADRHFLLVLSCHLSLCVGDLRKWNDLKQREIIFGSASNLNQGSHSFLEILGRLGAEYLNVT